MHAVDAPQNSLVAQVEAVQHRLRIVDALDGLLQVVDGLLNKAQTAEARGRQTHSNQSGMIAHPCEARLPDGSDVFHVWDLFLPLAPRTWARSRRTQ